LIALDSFGWIERFTNGPKATKYNKIIDQTRPEEIITSVVVLHEVYRKVKKLKGEQNALENVGVLSQTTIVPFDQTLALEAADFNLEYDLHFSDALIYATARRYETELYTSDEHFKDIPFVNYI
jgi:predicted nucleic acid-binding protein